MARYQRMRGKNVFYPMGFDDNGLPTERLVEKRYKVSASQIGRQAFIERCLQVSEEAEVEYRALWQRLGLSVDWRYTYRTIDAHSRRCSQYSFIDLYKKGLAYRAQAPTLWCPECHTAVAQADLEDRERTTEFVTLPFALEDGQDPLLIATTRPELLAACVAVFVHPMDPRYLERIGKKVRVPLYGHLVPVLADPAADPDKGTGAVMCCTFGDQADVAWWYGHSLGLVEVLDDHGRMLPSANMPVDFPSDVDVIMAGLTVEEADGPKDQGAAGGLWLDLSHASRRQGRCECTSAVIRRLSSASPTNWFLACSKTSSRSSELGEQIGWHPAHMHARYKDWVENLNWDWCISRQRYFGVPFPLWYCKQCGAVLLAV